MTRVDLDMPGLRVDTNPTGFGSTLVFELRAARKVIDALHAWEAMDGHYFGHTPEEGGDVGRALIAYERAVTS